MTQYLVRKTKNQNTDIVKMTAHQESRDQQFSAAAAMVLAASDLLRAASSCNSGQLSSSLDNYTLQNLAEAIYREVQVAEVLYIQLNEMLEQSRNEQVFLYPSYPQVSIPLTKLNLPQLEQLKEAAEIKQQTYESNADESNDNDHRSVINQLRETMQEIQLEISKRV